MSYINSNFKGISKQRNEISSIVSNNIFTDYLKVKKKTILNDVTVESGGIDVTGDSEFQNNIKVDGAIDVTQNSEFQNDLSIGGNIQIDGTLDVHNNILQYGYILLPKFCIIMWSGSLINIPNGWLLCDGSTSNINSIDVTAPDLSGKFILSYGQDTLDFINTTIGAVGGSQNVTLNSSQIPSHSHTGTTSTDGSHTHTHNATGGQGNYGLTIANGANTVDSVDSSLGELNVWTVPGALNINNDGSHSHTFTTNSTGGGAAHNNMPPYYVLCFIMKGF